MAKKLISLILSLFLCINVVYAEDLNLKSERYILYNLNDDKVILEKDANSQTSIASLTKIMTVLVACENNTDYSKKIKITNNMISGIASDVTQLHLKKGQVVTLDDMLYATMLSSAADAAQTLAYTTSGNIDSFVKLMNEKAEELHLENTHFQNVVGLYSKQNYSSAQDMATLLKYALTNEKFKSIFEAKEYKLTINKKVYSTISRYNKKSKQDISYITGSKTGYIKKAGYCLASTATINDIDYLLITLNAYNDSTAHIKDTIKIYNYFKDNYGYHEIINENDIITTLKVEKANIESIDIKSNYKKELYLKNDFDKSKIEYKYNGVENIKYNTKKGELLGSVDIIYNDEVLDTFSLYLDSTINYDKPKDLINYKSIILAISIVAILVLIIIFINLKRKIKKHKKQNK